MMIQNEDYFQDTLGSTILVGLIFELNGQLFPHFLNTSQWVWLIDKDEINESDWLISQLVLFKSGLLQKPSFPFRIPRGKISGIQLFFQISIQIALSIP
jgi:hypothetical protein